MERIGRYRGSLLGLAVGDALGTTLEFQPSGCFEPIDDIVGGGPFALRPGEWTDDTSMALCLAESLIERGGFDPIDQMQRCSCREMPAIAVASFASRACAGSVCVRMTGAATAACKHSRSAHA
jgi:ADP-ribosylglycohydrolase